MIRVILVGAVLATMSQWASWASAATADDCRDDRCGYNAALTEARLCTQDVSWVERGPDGSWVPVCQDDKPATTCELFAELASAIAEADGLDGDAAWEDELARCVHSTPELQGELP